MLSIKYLFIYLMDTDTLQNMEMNFQNFERFTSWVASSGHKRVIYSNIHIFGESKISFH